jgi:class 3 adenylate cyclase
MTISYSRPKVRVGQLIPNFAPNIWRNGAIAIVVGLLVAFLLLRSQALNVADHNRYSKAIVELSEVDARLNQAVLQVRYGLLNNYDPLVQGFTNQQTLHQTLNQLPDFINVEEQRTLQQLLQLHRDALQQKEQWVETFKSKNAILKNSLTYFPIAITNLVNRLDDRTLTNALNTLLQDVLIYNLSASEALHDTIQAQLAAIAQQEVAASNEIRAELGIVLAHARIILQQKSQVYTLVENIIRMPLLERTEAISNAYNQYYQNALNRTTGYRFWLYVVSIIITIGIAAIIITQLRQAAIALQREQERAERLLLNILPEPIAERLKDNQQSIAESFPDVTVLFADIVGFTQLAGHLPPTDLVNVLNRIFSAFDRLTERYGLEKIKTIGDAYMVVGGLPHHRPDHAEAIAAMALDMQAEIQRFNHEHQEAFKIRIGINTGPVVAGVIGIKKFIYDLWGDTVNIASRMESQGIAGRIQVSEATYRHLQTKFLFGKRGTIEVKGKGTMTTYLLLGKAKNPLNS